MTCASSTGDQKGIIFDFEFVMTNIADSYADLCERVERLPSVFDFIAEAKTGSEWLDPREVLDVLLIDQYFRWSRNQSIPVEHYLARLPGLEEHLAVPLLLEEYGYLQDRGLAPPAGDFVQRYRSLGADDFARLCESLNIDRSSLMDPTDDAAGTNVAAKGNVVSPVRRIGRYEVICLIGRGAFGEVFLGRDPSLDRSVAIKVPNRERMMEAGGPDQLMDEARVVARIDHPHVVPVYDYGKTDDGDCFIVSKYIRGRELRSEIRKPISHFEAAQITAALARALHAAHRVGVVHRDVKPSNVILDARRRPQLLDFGLALRKQHAPNTAALVGTPAYMSPEQVNGESHLVDGRSDIFSLGVIFYEMLAGRRPFQVTGSGQPSERMESAEAQPPRQFVDSIPRDLERICLEALALPVSKRFNTAGDFAEELERWIECVSAPGDTATESGVASEGSSIESSESTYPTNLPCRRDAVIGRATELVEVCDRLAQHPLVSIVGTGGAGKTTLAMEVGRHVRSRFPGGVWVCEFAPTQKSDQVLDELAQVTLGNAGTLQSLEKVTDQLNAQPTLLIFDNCEHLVDSIAQLTLTLLQGVAGLTILATSREALNVAGEFVCRVEGLSQTDQCNSAADLFISRASAVAGYQHSSSHDACVAEIVSRLEGLPLAIELAAAQMATMSIDELLLALDRQMETLQTRRRPANRQASATQTIGWSFDLLSADQQEALLALSVFVAPFTRDAAVAVSDPVDGSSRTLQGLVEQSMVVRTERHGRSRFRLLEPIRQFCQLRIAEEAHATALHRHARFFADRAPELGAGIYGFNELEMAEAFDVEWPDLRKAIAWGRAHLVPEVAIDPIIAMDRTLFLHGRVEAYQWMAEAVERFGNVATDRADVQRILGMGLYFRGEIDSAVTHLNRSDQLDETAECLVLLYSVLTVKNDFEGATAVLDRLENFLRANPGDREWRFWPTFRLSRALGNPLDPAFDEYLRLARENAMSLDWPTGQAHVLLIQGMILSQRGDTPELRDCLEMAKVLAESCGSITISTTAGMILAGCDPSAASANQQLSDAVGHLSTYADLGIESKGTTLMPLALRTIVTTLMECGEIGLAAKVSGFVRDLKGAGAASEFSPHYEGQLQQLADSMGAAELQRLQAEGSQLSLAGIIAACERILQTDQPLGEV